MDNREVASLVFESLDRSSTSIPIPLFFPGEREHRQVVSLCAEVFNGRRNRKLYSEYGHWLPYITDIYLSCCDPESGDFRRLPFAGSLMDKPYMTMQVIKLIQLNYRRHLQEQAKNLLKQ
jgi:hypothetical protein